jgi:hypothetical protein
MTQELVAAAPSSLPATARRRIRARRAIATPAHRKPDYDIVAWGAISQPFAHEPVFDVVVDVRPRCDVDGCALPASIEARARNAEPMRSCSDIGHAQTLHDRLRRNASAGPYIVLRFRSQAYFELHRDRYGEAREGEETLLAAVSAIFFARTQAVDHPRGGLHEARPPRGGSDEAVCRWRNAHSA